MLNSSAEESSFNIPRGVVLAAAIFEIIIFIVGTVGNLFTIVAVFRNRNLQYATNYLIVSLAVADLLVSTVLVPMRASQHIAYQRDRVIPGAVVQVAGFIGRVNIIASISTLVCLSIDRYLALSRPLRYATSIRYSLGRVSVAIATIWILAVVTTSIPKFPGVDDSPFLIFFVVFVLTATLVICIMYYLIFKIVIDSLRGKTKGKPVRYSNNFKAASPGHRNRALDNSSDSAKTRSETTTSADGVTICNDGNKEHTKSSAVCSDNSAECTDSVATSTEHSSTCSDMPGAYFSKEERKAAKTVGLVIAAFVVLVYPRVIMILYHFDHDETESSRAARFWMRVLLYLNSAVNPFFYAYRHKGFRNEFRKMGLKLLGLGTSLRERYVSIRRNEHSQSSTPTFYA